MKENVMQKNPFLNISILFRAFIALVLFSAFNSLALASLVYYDGFVAGEDLSKGEYVANPGADTEGRYRLTEGQNPNIPGFTGSWQHEKAPWDFGAPLAVAPIPSLEYPGVVSTGNAVARRWAEGMSYRRFDNVFRGEGVRVLYLSMLFQLSDPTAEGRFELSRIADSSRNGVGLDFNSIQRGRITPFGAFSNSPNTIPSSDQTNLLVIKFELSEAGSRFTMWLNPDDLSAEENNQPIFQRVVRNLDINYLVFKRFEGGTAENGIVFDELRIATAWDSDLFEGTLRRSSEP